MARFAPLRRSLAAGWWYPILLAVLPLPVSSALTYYALRHAPLIRAFEPREWAAAFALSAVTMAFALTPTTLVALLGGYFLGVGAIVPVSAAYLVASAIGYAAARRFDGGRTLAWLSAKPKVVRLLAGLRQREWALVAWARLSPVLPFAATNALLAAAGVRPRNYFTAGFVGMLPRTLLATVVGSQATTLAALLQRGDARLQAGVAALVVVSLAALAILVRRARQQGGGNIPPPPIADR